MTWTLLLIACSLSGNDCDGTNAGPFASAEQCIEFASTVRNVTRAYCFSDKPHVVLELEGDVWLARSGEQS